MGAPPADTEPPIRVGEDLLTLLWEGPQRLTALLAMIEAAESSVRLLFYMFTADRSGEQVRDALAAAAGRGVTVSLLIDQFGSGDLRADFFQPLVEAGGKYCQFHPSWGRRYLLRNHQKIVIVDGRVAITGGANISDPYFDTSPETGWRDLWVMVDGPAAGRLCAYFDAVLGWATRHPARIRDLRRILRRHTEIRGPLEWQFGGPMRRWSPWAAAVSRDIARASRLAIISAYFSPPRGLLRRIAKAGGRPRIITAAKSDNTATIAAAHHTYSRLLRRGVRLFEYQRMKLHTKLLIADDVVHIGSANLDFRSLYLNLEVMLRVADRRFAERMRRDFEAELDDCTEITPELHKQRATWWRRVQWLLAHFLVTTMDYTVTRRLNFRGER